MIFACLCAFAIGLVVLYAYSNVRHISARACTSQAHKNPAHAVTGKKTFYCRPGIGRGKACTLRVQFDIVDKKGKGLFGNQDAKEKNLAYYKCSPLEMEQAFMSGHILAIELELTMLQGDIKGEDGRIFDPKTQKLCPRFSFEPVDGSLENSH